MLAEAMVDDFAGCFAGVGFEAAERLANAFAFANCQVRTPLADILSTAVAARTRDARQASDDSSA
jgi:hypothetical protein